MPLRYSSAGDVEPVHGLDSYSVQKGTGAIEARIHMSSPAPDADELLVERQTCADSERRVQELLVAFIEQDLGRQDEGEQGMHGPGESGGNLGPIGPDP